MSLKGVLQTKVKSFLKIPKKYFKKEKKKTANKPPHQLISTPACKREALFCVGRQMPKCAIRYTCKAVRHSLTRA